MDTIWTLPQLLWVKEHEPEVWQRTKRILFAKDFVRHQLTGDYVTDYIEAEGSMLVDYRTPSWSGGAVRPARRTARNAAAAGAAGGSCRQCYGCSSGGYRACGRHAGAVRHNGYGDGGAWRQACIEKGQMTVKMATAGRICAITDRLYTLEHLVNYSHVQPGLWYRGTATKSCAASLRWYRDTFGQSYKELDEAARGSARGLQRPAASPLLKRRIDALCRSGFVRQLLRASAPGIPRRGLTVRYWRGLPIR